ncbi:AAA-like domain-containing protein [Microcoleus sp. FACHB-SPT15]|nr:AAA-like domain-containing protein [Microcoleus sp. FACHB-SPT15]MBD1805690.1 AAA-like domain-containing protein [Microcoleus sp. FACHB-SPT15]
MGLVNLQGNRVTLSCDLYRQYFGDRVPGISRSYQC